MQRASSEWVEVIGCCRVVEYRKLILGTKCEELVTSAFAAKPKNQNVLHPYTCSVSEKAKCSHSGRTTTYLDSSSSFVLFSVLMELYRGCAHEIKAAAAVGTRFSIRFWCFHYSYHMNVLMCACVPTWPHIVSEGVNEWVNTTHHTLISKNVKILHSFVLYICTVELFVATTHLDDLSSPSLMWCVVVVFLPGIPRMNCTRAAKRLHIFHSG